MGGRFTENFALLPTVAAICQFPRIFALALTQLFSTVFEKRCCLGARKRRLAITPSELVRFPDSSAISASMEIESEEGNEREHGGFAKRGHCFACVVEKTRLSQDPSLKFLYPVPRRSSRSICRFIWLLLQTFQV